MHTYLYNGANSSRFVGWYADDTALNRAYPTSTQGAYAIVTSTNTIWYWDAIGLQWADSLIAPSVGNLIPSNEIYINTSETEVFGKQYKSFAAAFLYLAHNQTVGYYNAWTIRFSGTIPENLTVPPYVSIIGEDRTMSIITGWITLAGATGDFANFTAYQILTDTDQVWYCDNVFILDSVVSNPASTGFFKNCYLFAGDYTGFGFLELTNTEIEGSASIVKLPAGLKAVTCKINCAVVGIIDLQGGSIIGGTFVGLDLANISAGKYFFDNVNCDSGGNIVVLGDRVNVNFVNSNLYPGGFRVRLGARLVTVSSPIKAVSVDPGGVLNCTGGFYDNTTSGLAARDYQTAIDELKALIDAISF